jgi:4-hydroxyphenylpyruvate dioxygenase
MTTITPSTASRGSVSTDPLALIDVDHVRFYVGNAKQAAFFYASAFGFTIEQINDLTTAIAAAPSTCSRRATFVCCSRRRLVADHVASEEVRRFGDGIKDIALTVFDAEKTYEAAVRNGGESAHEPRTAKGRARHGDDRGGEDLRPRCSTRS